MYNVLPAGRTVAENRHMQDVIRTAWNDNFR